MKNITNKLTFGVVWLACWIVKLAMYGVALALMTWYFLGMLFYWPSWYLYKNGKEWMEYLDPELLSLRKSWSIAVIALAVGLCVFVQPLAMFFGEVARVPIFFSEYFKKMGGIHTQRGLEASGALDRNNEEITY